MRYPALGCVLIALLASACGDPAVLTVDVTVGHETDAFTRAPAITSVEVVGNTPEGDLLISASAPPGGSLTLGEVEEDRLVQFDAWGTDVAGATSAAGRALAVVVGGIEGGVLPLFAQRVDEWARPPSELEHTHVAGVAATLAERYLLVTGGLLPDGDETGKTTSSPAFYDLLALGPASGADFPRSARSIVMAENGIEGVLVDDTGATWVDFESSSTQELALPDGLGSFADVAGGIVVEAPDGGRYLVGATRADSPTDAVLVWEPDVNPRAARLAYPRAGAAAAWVESVGLVVVGGSADAPALEVLAAGASGTVTRPYAPDPTAGAAAVARNGGQLVVLGGHTADGPGTIRALDASCTGSCEPTVLELAIDAALAGCQAYALDADHVVLVGTDSDDLVGVGASSVGMTRSFALDLLQLTVTELPLRDERAGASSVPTPHGLLALLGGVRRDGTAATTVELLFPATELE